MKESAPLSVLVLRSERQLIENIFSTLLKEITVRLDEREVLLLGENYCFRSSYDRRRGKNVFLTL